MLETDVTIKLGKYPDGDKTASRGGGNGGDEDTSGKELEDLGLTLAPTPEGKKNKDGVEISGVDAASKAADQGVKRGDVILEVNGKPVSSVDDVVAGIREAREKGRKTSCFRSAAATASSASLPFPSTRRLPTPTRTKIRIRTRIATETHPKIRTRIETCTETGGGTKTGIETSTVTVTATGTRIRTGKRIWIPIGTDIETETRGYPLVFFISQHIY